MAKRHPVELNGETPESPSQAKRLLIPYLNNTESWKGSPHIFGGDFLHQSAYQSMFEERHHGFEITSSEEIDFQRMVSPSNPNHANHFFLEGESIRGDHFPNVKDGLADRSPFLDPSIFTTQLRTDLQQEGKISELTVSPENSGEATLHCEVQQTINHEAKAQTDGEQDSDEHASAVCISSTSILDDQREQTAMLDPNEGQGVALYFENLDDCAASGPLAGTACYSPTGKKSRMAEPNAAFKDAIQRKIGQLYLQLLRIDHIDRQLAKLEEDRIQQDMKELADKLDKIDHI